MSKKHITLDIDCGSSFQFDVILEMVKALAAVVEASHQKNKVDIDFTHLP